MEIFENWGVGTTAKFDNSYGNKIKVKQLFDVGYMDTP